jgi:LacI family transcriptional regulator, repressor for deo operon, udp, cdd, tsx, nupC, and nupG
MRPRLREVAEHAGVSQATVSRVLNGQPGVADATRRTVLEALSALGYAPVGVGRMRRAQLVGLILPELDNPVFPLFAQAIESRLARFGLTTVLCTSTPAGMREGAYLDVLLEHGVVGVVMVSGEHADTTEDHRRYRELRARGVPTVTVNGSNPTLDVHAVTVDHVAAAREAVLHLASLGHRRIGLACGPRRYIPTREFTTGFEDGCRAAGITADAALVAESVYGIEGGHAAGLRLLEAGATGVVCTSDRMAMGLLGAATERGLRVPDDLSVVGFDDAGPNAYVDPPLTSTRQPFTAMADAVVDLLVTSINDPSAASTSLRFRPSLVVRASTGPVRVPATP